MDKIPDLTAADFDTFFHEVHSYNPFPWQRMLLDRIASGGDWPQAIDLPTASGKTACIDIAVFALALQAELEPMKRIARRRIFFVVDRRIVVDEAFDRAVKIADALAEAKSGILKVVADRLRWVSGGDTPLAVAKLRGGIARIKQHWSADPMQAAVITSTVDQIGSRLLFRSYSGSNLVAPVHAALAAYDSLIILDEAHCARPFMQTVSSIGSYLNIEKWSLGKVAIAPPLKLMIMSATAPHKDFAGMPLEKFPNASERDAALNAPDIGKRSSAVKLAKLQLINQGGSSALVTQAVKLAGKAVKDHHQRVAIMVNRVNLAHQIVEKIKETAQSANTDVVLLTGRMRPIDRDDIIEKWSLFLRAANPLPPIKPIVIVTTQCLEVGADFSFDFLITQCASIDALLQRFGRLDRFGDLHQTRAVILTSKDDVSENADDPIYGTGIAKTWQWLREQSKDSSESDTVNFAINVIGEKVRQLDPQILEPMLAPHPDAPVLMPSHVDILCQTAPHPIPDIDIPAYLHGVGRGQPEVRVAFRVDIGATDQVDSDNEGINAYFMLCPPNQSECLSVPIFRLKKYLLGHTEKTEGAGDEDVEGAVISERNISESQSNAGKQ